MNVLARGFGLAFVVVTTALLLHASRFWPDGVELAALGRDDWLHRALPPELRVYSLLIWAGACVALLSFAQWLVAACGRLASRARRQ